MKVAIEYGKKEVLLNVPKKRFRGVIEPKKVKAISNLPAAVKRALAAPVGSKPFAKMLEGAKTALILTVDHTRPSPRPMLEPILKICEETGVKPTICIATGRHRQMTDKELVSHFGKAILRRVKVIQHDPFDRKAHKRLGRTKLGTEVLVNKIVFEHDRVIGVGIIEPSYLCGFSGGRKLIMPGVAFHTSIDNNHFYLTDPATKIGVLKKNPVSDDATEFSRLCPLHFICYSISGPNDEVVGVVAGDPYKAHQTACDRCERIYRVKSKTAPIVIASAGGHPYDCDLVQGKKAIIPAIDLVERNGVVILLAACPEGLGAEETFIKWLTTKTPVEVVRDVRNRKLFNLGAHGANILARSIVEKNATVILVTNPKIAKAIAGSYIHPVTRFEDAWELANRLCGKDAEVLVIRKARRLICG